MNKLINSYLEQIYNIDNVVKEINVSAGIIFKEQKGEKPALLLIQRSKDDHYPLFYEIPRGKCDKGTNEDLMSCLKREVKEETGLDIIPLKFIDKFQYTADKGTRLSTQHNFLCKMKDPTQQVKLSKEHQNYQWITTAGEAELMVLPEMKKSIIKAFEILDSEGQIFNNPSNEFTPNSSIAESLFYHKKCLTIKNWADRIRCMKERKPLKEFIEPISLTVALSIFVAGSLYGYLNDSERIYIKNKCKKFEGVENKKCRIKTHIEMMKGFLSKIPQYRLRCKKEKSPERCMKVLDKTEARIIRKIQEKEEEFRRLG